MPKGNSKKPIISKILFMVILCEIAGAAGSVFTISSIATWYSSLIKPDFAPPNWLFAPVWITLFALMGISAGIVWNSNSKKKNEALLLFGAQVALNVTWSALFFGLHFPAAAFAEIVILWAAIAVTGIKFYGISKTAGWLLVPYLAWVSIAAFLNYSIWMLN